MGVCTNLLILCFIAFNRETCLHSLKDLHVQAIYQNKIPLSNNNNNNNNNMYLKSSIQTSSIDYIQENIHITLNISSNIPIQYTKNIIITNT